MTNIIAVLQLQPVHQQNHFSTQIASQYLNALLEYQTSDDAQLNDPSSPQYYLSTALNLLNYLTANPDICKRNGCTPNLVNNIIDKLLMPSFQQKMRAAPRPAISFFPPATFDDDFGSLLQFLSTILLYKAEIDASGYPLNPRITELMPKLLIWKQSRVSFHKTVTDRLVDQIEGMDAEFVATMRKMQEKSLSCGVASCRVRGTTKLTVCSTCRIQRYCGRVHQKADWKYHKHICNKGLEEQPFSETDL